LTKHPGIYALRGIVAISVSTGGRMKNGRGWKSGPVNKIYMKDSRKAANMQKGLHGQAAIYRKASTPQAPVYVPPTRPNA
jgi:hypothetical protein